MARYLRDRDTAALDATMRRLDGEEAAARQPRVEEGVPADVALRYLRELPETWARRPEARGAQLLADALFERIEVLGLREATAHLSEHAVRHGLAAVLPEEFGISVSGRGERSRDDDNHVIVGALVPAAGVGLIRIAPSALLSTAWRPCQGGVMNRSM